MHAILLFITAIIWGLAFVAQSSGGDTAGPFTFNCIRSLLGSAVLVPVFLIFDRGKDKERYDRKTLVKAGVICGVLMFFASNTQQLGINLGCDAGKAGFITATYILMVPVFGLFLKKKCGWNVWLAVFLALVGLYMLCLKTGTGGIGIDDALVLLCAVCFTVHILTVDHFSPKVNGVKLSCIQFLVSGTLGIIPSFFLEVGTDSVSQRVWLSHLMTADAWIPILYAGIMSCGVAYTFQIIGQKGTDPAVASLIMSLESVFAALGGALILGERMTADELMGCCFMFAAIILAQIKFKRSRKGNDGAGSGQTANLENESRL
ncbi:MAG: DMT family transporter [Lachnospiraceae bacterium]|nr:DMT family transporter [Lachnospiraceae bacterium]